MNNRTAKILSVLVASLVLTFPAAVLPQAGETMKGGIPIQSYRLRNGLRVILSEDDSLPVVSVVVAYSAGSFREQEGQVGLAYLMENLMFQGSENVGPLQHFNFIQKIGGELNALTTADKAIFYEMLPSNQLALALWLESDRMKSWAVSPNVFEKTREDLLEQQRLLLSSEPYVDSFSTFDALLFPDFRFGHPLIGHAEDFEGIKEVDLKAFHAAYYVPNNAVLCIVGDIQLAKTKDLIVSYFESIPPGADVPGPPLPRFTQNTEVTKTVKDPLAPSPGFHIGFRIYPLQTGDLYALRILDYLLLREGTSRLYTRLLKKDRTAVFMNGSLEERLGVHSLKIFVMNNNVAVAERCQKTILSEIERLKYNLVPEGELTRAKNLFKMDYLNKLGSGMDRALFLVDASFSNIPLESLAGELDKYLRVTPESLHSLVIRHFIPQRRVVLNVRTE